MSVLSAICIEMPHLHSPAARATRLARAIEKGFVAKSLITHGIHCQMPNKDIHRAASADDAVKPITGGIAFKATRSLHKPFWLKKEANSARHSWAEMVKEGCSSATSGVSVADGSDPPDTLDALFLNDPWARAAARVATKGHQQTDRLRATAALPTDVERPPEKKPLVLGCINQLEHVEDMTAIWPPAQMCERACYIISGLTSSSAKQHDCCVDFAAPVLTGIPLWLRQRSQSWCLKKGPDGKQTR